MGQHDWSEGFGAGDGLVGVDADGITMGVIVRRSASMAELSDCAPIWEWEVAPLVRAAWASLLATRVSSSLPKHDSREMALYAFGSLYVGLPFLGITMQ